MNNIKKIVWFQNLCSSRLLIRQNYLIIDNGVQYGVMGSPIYFLCWIITIIILAHGAPAKTL